MAHDTKPMILKRIYRAARRHGNEILTSDWSRWSARGFSAPSPDVVKRRRLLANGLPDATWIETGTYKGDTSALLSKVASKVYTLEPADGLFEKAQLRFKNNPVVEVIHGTSEDVFPRLLPDLTGDLVFWLDGHYSAGETYQGALETPIRVELKEISRSLPKWGRVVILVDDIRCFNPLNNQWAQYPSIDFLVDWAREHKLQWHIEHDIFVATNVHGTGELGGFSNLSS